METGQAQSVRSKFPTTQQEADEAAQLLADEMNKLSLEEQEQMLFDVHGLDQSHDEDPEDLDKPIVEMENHILKIPEKSSYERAKYFNREYVHDKKFLLMFLRSERFDVEEAAKRLVRHFEAKERLFGTGEVLGRDIRLSDMTAEDMSILESGYLQVLPRRDLAGRSVVFYAMAHRPKNATLVGLNRTYWYMLTTTLKDEETQKKGIVHVAYNIGNMARPDQTLVMTQLDSVVQAIPKKPMGMHYCFDDAALGPYVTGLHLYLDKAIKHRFRPHFGEDAEFELQTYGIPIKDGPLQPNGDLSLAWHREWLNIRRTQEESEGSVDGIIVPRRFDVLFGRGRGTRDHTGNLRAVHIVELFQAQYDKAKKGEKTRIGNRVVAMIKESLGRFLKWEDHGWIEVTDEEAREKVSHFFRHLRSKQSSRSEPTSSKEASDAKAKRITPEPAPASVDLSRAPKQFRTAHVG